MSTASWAQSTQALDEANGQIVDTWSAVQPVLATGIAEAVTGLTGQEFANVEVKYAYVNALDTASPPKIKSLTPGLIEILAPAGTWAVGIKFKVDVDFGLFTEDFKITATLSKLRVTLKSIQDLTDPLRPTIAEVQPKIEYELSLSSSNFLANTILSLFEAVLDNPLTKAIGNVILTYYVNSLLIGAPGPILAEGAPFPSIAPATSLLVPALEMRAAVVQNHLPHGLPVDVAYNEDGTIFGTWRHGDATIYAGHLLAAMAFSHHATSDPDAISTALLLLKGIRRSLDVGSSGTYQIGTQVFSGPALPDQAKGRLVRYAARPGDSFQGEITFGQNYEMVSAQKNRPMATAILDDEMWYGHPKPTSRDQYVGVVQGLAFAHALIDDPEVRALAKECLTRILNYLTLMKWTIDEPNGSFSASFVTAYAHLVAFALAGREVDPAAFGPLVDELGPLSELIWSGAWFDTFDTHGKYYKFDLLHSSLLTSMTLEDDPDRWLAQQYALRILKRAIGHHQIPYYEAIYAIGQPEEAPAWAPKIEEGLKQYLMRPRNPVPQAWTSPETAQFLQQQPTMEWEPTLDFSFGLGGEVNEEESETIAADIIPLAYRPHRAYMWARSPFTVEYAEGNPNHHYPGVDYQLAYWLALDSGLVPAEGALAGSIEGTAAADDESASTSPGGGSCGAPLGSGHAAGHLALMLLPFFVLVAWRRRRP